MIESVLELPLSSGSLHVSSAWSRLEMHICLLNPGPKHSDCGGLLLPVMEIYDTTFGIRSQPPPRTSRITSNSMLPRHPSFKLEHLRPEVSSLSASFIWERALSVLTEYKIDTLQQILVESLGLRQGKGPKVMRHSLVTVDLRLCTVRRRWLRFYL